VPAGLPSQLLERRPDVCAAEERLRAANDRVGAAMAQYFPTVSLTGFLGGQTRELSNLMDPGAAAWSLVGGILQPLFQGGRIRKLNQAARADWEATAEAYLATAQRSFQETADALVTVVKLREAVVEQERRVDALSVGLRLAKARYEGGLSSYLEVLDADRQLYAGANDLAGARGDLQRSYVQLYRALGGGWDADVAPAAGGAAAE
jgi:multidrug efflux system outer membrane protein